MYDGDTACIIPVHEKKAYFPRISSHGLLTWSLSALSRVSNLEASWESSKLTVPDSAMTRVHHWACWTQMVLSSATRMECHWACRIWLAPSSAMKTGCYWVRTIWEPSWPWGPSMPWAPESVVGGKRVVWWESQEIPNRDVRCGTTERWNEKVRELNSVSSKFPRSGRASSFAKRH